MRLNKSVSIKVLTKTILISCLALIINSKNLHAQIYPSGFSQVQLASGLNDATAMTFAPDGRLFICLKGGSVVIFKNGALNNLPFLTLNVSTTGERGIEGLAFDPNFSYNKYVYIYYTVASGTNNRISRFVANGDIAGPENVILELDPLTAASNHNGGHLEFGIDNKLYVSVGDNYKASNPQNLDTYHGKLLRINSDGSVPAGNPYTTGSNQKKRIWSYGLRNPFSFDIQPVTGKIFLNEVGFDTWEEINDATLPNKNFAWPLNEGFSGNTSTDPVYAYTHGTGDNLGCAISGGTFFNPTTTNYPSTYIGNYFYTDYCGKWLNRLDLSTTPPTRYPFATTLGGFPVALTVGNDGNLYYLSRITGFLYKIIYSAPASPPMITTQPLGGKYSVLTSLTLTVAAGGSNPMTFQWKKNNIDIAGATSADFTINSLALSDSGTYKCIVTNTYGSATSTNAKITITNNTPPVATITSPTDSSYYSGDETINFSGTATDLQDGVLPGSAYLWILEFHHDSHYHPGPLMPDSVTSGSIIIPNSGEISADVYYRLFLIVTDSDGASDTAFVDIYPRKSYISISTDPPGLEINLDGIPTQTPANILSVEGVIRSVSPTTPQLSNSTTYVFDHWSTGGAVTKTFATPENDTAFIAHYIISYRFPENPASTAAGLHYNYYEGSFSLIPDFNTLTTVEEGSVTNFDLSPRNIQDNFAFSFNGYVNVPTDGIYTFYTSSDDGSNLYIGNLKVVDNDGLHPIQERSGTIGLKAGKHLLKVNFIEKTGANTLIVSWAGPGFGKQQIPSASLSRLAGTVTTPPIQDAYVRTGSYTNNSLGNSDPLKLVTRLSDASNDGLRETYLMFDITGFTNEYSSATLDLYGKLKGTDLASFPQMICVPLANTFWSETNITYSNRPLSTSSYLDLVNVNLTTGKYYNFDITSYLTSQINSGATKVSLIIRGNNILNNYVQWNSKETTGAFGPRLTLNYAVPREVENGNLSQSSDFSVSIYPNPSHDDIINVAMQSHDEKAEIRIVDMDGRQLSSTFTDAELTRISIGNIQNGLYLVQVILNDKMTIKKLQVIR